MPEMLKVRLAMPAEAPIIAEVQHAAWAANPLIASSLAEVPLAEAAQAWHQVIVAPPLAHYRVLVALDGPHLAGFTLIGPSDDEDAEATDALVHEFAVHPKSRRQGHGSRLMHAAVDTMHLDGYQRATWWVASTDDTLRRFLTGTGWAPDGAYRELASDDESARLKQVRMHTDISVP